MKNGQTTVTHSVEGSTIATTEAFERTNRANGDTDLNAWHILKQAGAIDPSFLLSLIEVFERIIEANFN